MNEKVFNKWFNAFILIGMSLCVILSCIFECSKPDARIALLIVSSVGALMGVVSTILSANGNILTYVFGLVDVLIYAYILFISKNPAQFCLYVFYFIPMEFIGFFSWKRKGAGGKGKLRAQRIRKSSEWLKFALIFMGVFILAGAVSWFVLDKSGAEYTWSKVVLDALVTTANIVAFSMGAFAYMEQWYLWLLVNLGSVAIWTLSLIHNPSDGYALIPLVKYAFYLINGINGLRIWYRLSAPENAESPEISS